LKSNAPVDAINKASAREKSIRHGHPSTLHLWWARRALAAARAMKSPNPAFAQVDGPLASTFMLSTKAGKPRNAQAANRILGRKGAFWLEEYFDRVIRDEIHYGKIVEYIEQNPVKAGRCSEAAECKFGSAYRGEEKRAGRPGSQDDVFLDAGGTGATAYADAVGVYLALAVDRMATTLCTITRWTPERQQTVTAFARQAIPMTWDFPDVNPFANAAGDYGRHDAGDAPTATRREFVTALKSELPVALTHLQRGNIAPVDLAHAAIGPGMAVYTRYALVLDAESKPLSLREALALIIQTLDEALAE
jgi:hypothetical protein